MTSPLITLMTSSYTGGIGRNLSNLANSFIRLGYRADILVDREKFPYAGDLDESVGIKYLRTSHRIGGIPHLLAYFIKHKPEIVLTPFVQLTLLAVRTRRLFRVPVKIFANIHSVYSIDFASLNERKRKKRVDDMMKYYPQCNSLISVSDGAAKDFSKLTGLPEAPIHRIFNPVVTDDLIERSMSRPDHPWFQTDQPPVIIGIGRLVKNKNFDHLIEVFDILREKRECRLVIVGEGPARTDLDSIAENSPFRQDIFFTGRLENPFPYLRYASVMVLTSSYEGLSNTIIEALALGTPVVSTDCPFGPREILEGGRFGELVPVNDVKALSEAILKTLRNPIDHSILVGSAERFRDTDIARSYLSAFGLPEKPLKSKDLEDRS